ncbi:MAG: hypothetical protein MUF34_27755 [Polyangiaceae bacterium]|nr:hypothetical protein [Polyangiaceae bacterium]
MLRGHGAQGSLRLAEAAVGAEHEELDAFADRLAANDGGEGVGGSDGLVVDGDDQIVVLGVGAGAQACFGGGAVGRDRQNADALDIAGFFGGAADAEPGGGGDGANGGGAQELAQGLDGDAEGGRGAGALFGGHAGAAQDGDDAAGLVDDGAAELFGADLGGHLVNAADDLVVGAEQIAAALEDDGGGDDAAAGVGEAAQLRPLPEGVGVGGVHAFGPATDLGNEKREVPNAVAVADAGGDDGAIGEADGERVAVAEG